jgi:S1-C subfamily serine protease
MPFTPRKLLLHLASRKLLLVTALVLEMLAAAPAVAGGLDPAALQAVVGVRAVRGFQGLFECVPGASDADEGALLGGPLETSGTVVDLQDLASEEGIRLPLAVGADDLFVLTTFRSIHNARHIVVKQTRQSGGLVPEERDLTATVVSSDPAVNLALLKIPAAGDPARPRGLRLDRRGRTAPGLAALLAHFEEGQIRVRRETVCAIEAVGEGDPFWQPDLPALRLQGKITGPASGSPLLSDPEGVLLGLAANGARHAADSEHARASGPEYVIPADRVRSFLTEFLRQKSHAHGSLPLPYPDLELLGPDLVDLLGLACSHGYLVLHDWGPPGQRWLAAGDVLLAAGGRRLGAGGFSLGQVVFEAPPETPLQVEGIRDGRPWNTAIPLTPYREVTAARVETLGFAGAWFQDPQEIFFEPTDERRGVLVAHVLKGSPAEAAGLEFHNLVQEVFALGRTYPVVNVADLRRALQDLSTLPGYRGEIGLRVTDPGSPNPYAALRVLRLPNGSDRGLGAKAVLP